MTQKPFWKLKRTTLLFLLLFLISGNSLLAHGANSDEMPNFFIDETVNNKKIIKSGVKQLANTSTFHLFSHGQPGELLIQGEWKNSIQIKNWIMENQIPLKNKQLNIYGCHFAKGEKGKAAVSYLETALGISIAASDDITGKDGDWELEVGMPINSLTLYDYAYNLQTVTIVSDDFSSGTVSGGSSGWSSDWILVQEAAFQGGELFMDGGTPYGSATRSVDLSAYAVAQISLSGRCTDSSGGFEDDDEVLVEISIDGGTNFLSYWSKNGDQICPEANDAESQTISNIAIPAGNVNTVIRLRSATLSSSEDYYWDNVLIEGITTNDYCNAAISGNIDTDGDNVADICDLDNDNDGILDSDECVTIVSLLWENITDPQGSLDFDVTNIDGSTLDLNVVSSFNNLVSTSDAPDFSSSIGGTLQFGMDGSDITDPTQNSVYTFTFSEDVIPGSFSIHDIDRSEDAWQDVIEVEAFDANNNPVNIDVALGSALSYNAEGFVTDLTDTDGQPTSSAPENTATYTMK